MKNKVEEIDTDIQDILNTEFSYINTKSVPSLEDPSLTFGNGEEKRAKVINTCVLFADIRNSVALTKKHQTKTMGKLYSAFAKAVIKAAHHHNGFVRNIIGDRVMVVFPSENCYKNAVDCAITINHVCNEVLNKKFKEVDFKCGIGVDYGELKVIKVGTPKKGEEAFENRGLVWTGYPANLASRLTDIANKNLDETYYEVKRNPLNPFGFNWLFGSTGLSPLFGLSTPKKEEPLYLNHVETVEMTPEGFAASITNYSSGKLDANGGKFISFKKKSRKIKYPAILISKGVYNGYKKENPNKNDIKNGWWEKNKYEVKDVKDEVYGSSLTWKINN